ncbi:MAG: hypothetical protein WD595_04470, partial [Waddliaceae bacterium]
WEYLTNELKELFGIKELQFTVNPTNWKTSDKLLSGISSPELFAITLSPLEGNLYFAMSSQELSSIASLLYNNTLEYTNLPEEALKGFSLFLGVEVLSIVRNWEGLDSLSPQIKQISELPELEMIGIDIGISLFGHSFWSRLLISPTLHDHLKKHFHKKVTLETMDAAHLEAIPITLGLNIGEVTLTQEEWKELKPGDFLFLDHCSADLKNEKTKVLLTLDDIPLFRGKIKSGKIKILEHPLRYEKG